MGLGLYSELFPVVRFDAGGTRLWDTKLGDDLSVVGVSSVAVDREGNIVLAGYFSGNVSLGGASFASPGQATFVAKYSGDGDPIFGRAFSGSGHADNRHQPGVGRR